MKTLNRWTYAVFGVIILLFAGMVYAWSVLSSPIAVEFASWTKAQLSLTFTIVMIMFCIGGLAGGLLIKKINARIFGFAAAALFLAGFYLSSRSRSLVMLYLSFGVLCGFSSGLAYNSVMSSVCKWFPDKQGLISGILLMGFGIGSFIVGKLYQYYTPDEIGAWRSSFVFLGIITFVVMIICSFFLIMPGKDFTPPKATERKRVQNSAALDVSAGIMLRKPVFWFYYLWTLFLSAAGLSLISQASNVAREVGPAVSAGTIATVVGLTSVFNGIGRVIAGGLYDKLGRGKTMQTVNVLFLITAGVLVLALKTGSFTIVILGFILGGLSFGGVSPTNSAFVSSYFGMAHYPVNLPIMNTNVIFASFGSTVAGALYDSSHSYFSTYIFIAVLAVLGIFLSLLISLQDKKTLRK